ncbi:MAG: TIGR03986 family CRISPR-associated RAMP protein [Clostridium sp.]|nr:TIGR03986 family CRISPR-associated RAMP protein [Clostridium sp.]
MTQANTSKYSIITDQSVAPYNFVPLPDRAKSIAKKIEELQNHEEINDKKYSGYIEYEIDNKTPLIVGKEKNGSAINFFKNSEGKYAIPGSTIRGLLRNNTAILSFSNISDDIEDGRHYYRSFGIDKLREDYINKLEIDSKTINGESVLMPHKIETGYIYKKSEDEYVLVPFKKINDYSYLVIKEQYLRKLAPRDLSINYMYTEKILDLINNKEKYFLTAHEKTLSELEQKKIKQNKEKCKREFLKSIYKKNRFQLSSEPLSISYETNGKRIVTKIGHPNKYKNKGYLLTSGYIAKKLVHYIIPKEEDNDVAEISFKRGTPEYSDIEYYNNDLLVTKKASIKNGKIVLNGNYSYYGLPDKIGKEHGKPIFYGKSNNSHYFGFTPYLRIPYDNKIKDGINESYKMAEGYSYVDKLFGFANKDESYKGLLNFEDCICVSKGEPKIRNYKIILAEPHSTSYNLYLKQYGDNVTKQDKKKIINYNDDFEIRGIKQYWLKDYITESEGAKSTVVSKVNAMDENNKFKGRINFSNLSKEELGLILWALKVDSNAHDNIGMGKPYGFGHIIIDNINLKLENLEDKYFTMSLDYFKDANKDDFINAYKSSIGNNINSSTIKDFINIKTNIISADNKNRFRYMKIKMPNNGENEFKELKKFPNISEQINSLR